LEEVLDSDKRLLAGLWWLEVEDAAAMQILAKGGLIKGNAGVFGMDYGEDHESTELQIFDIAHRPRNAAPKITARLICMTFFIRDG